MEYWTCFLKLYVRLSLCLNNVLKETYLCLFRFCRFDFGDLTNIRVGVKVLARSVVVHRTHWTSLCHSFTTSGPTHPDHWIREDSFLLLSLTHTQSTPPPLLVPQVLLKHPQNSQSVHKDTSLSPITSTSLPRTQQKFPDWLDRAKILMCELRPAERGPAGTSETNARVCVRMAAWTSVWECVLAHSCEWDSQQRERINMWSQWTQSVVKIRIKPVK